MAVNKIKTLFNKNTLLKHTSFLAGGILTGQIISIISSPILTRIYTPKDFGILTIFLSIISIISVASALRFELAIPLPEDNKTGYVLFLISLFFVFIITLISIVFILFFDTALIPSLSELNSYLYLIPIGIFFTGFYLVLNHYSIRKNAFKIISKTKIYQSVIGVFLQIILGLLSFRPIGLLVGSIFKRASGFYLLLSPVIEDRSILKEITFSDVKKIFWEYKKFPLISSQSAIINVLGLNLPVLLLAEYYDAISVGYFSLTVMVISLPVSTLSRALSQVFFKESADLFHSNINDLNTLYFKILTYLFLIGLIPALILILFGPNLFGTIFGSKWEIAGKISQILSIMYLIQFIVVPTSQLLTIMKRQEIQLFWDIFRLATVFLSIYFSYKFHFDFIKTIYIFSFGMAFTYVLLIIIQIILLRKSIHEQ